MSAAARTPNWRAAKLEDLVFFQRGFDITQAQQRPGAYPVISSSGVTSHHDEFKARGPGIVIGRKGTLGSIHFTRGDYWPHDTTLWSKDLKGNSPRFVYYFLHTLDFKRFDVGNSNPTLNRNHIHDLPVRIPPSQIQEDIANVLSAYDDLIENNRRRMELLEQAPRLLYQEWFVRLRFPGHEHAGFADDVPEGWDRIQLNSFIKLTHGFAFQGSYFSDTPTSRILTTPGNFKIGGGIKVDKPKYYSDEGPLEPSYVLAPMDLILTMTDLSQMGDTLGFPAFVPKLDGRSFLHNQRVGKVVPNGQFFPKHFLYCLFCDDRYRHHVVGAATGTSVKHTSPKRILSYTVILPSRGGLIASFEELVEPLFRQINCLIDTNQKLRAARDLLLPRLMSGEIAV